MLPQRFYVTQQAGGGDRHVYANRTRFIPGTIEDRFERVAWPAAPRGAGADGAASSRPAAIDLAAQARRRWE
jgi:DNA helicase-2/ATP-dependent DNA helicase PcrA